MSATAAERADERGERHERVVAAEPGRGGDDHDRHRQPGAGRGAEQVRVGERVAEHALVGGAGHREHRPDEEPHDDAREPQLGDDRLLGCREARVDPEQWDVAEQRLERRDGPDRGRADREPEHDGQEHRADPREKPRRPQPHRLHRGHRARRSGHSCFVAFTIAWNSCTTRGPHRDARSSFNGIT